MNLRFFKIGLVLALAGLARVAVAYDPHKPETVMNETPAVLKAADISEKLGERIELSTKFKDENGQEVSLGQFFHQDRPVVLSIVYYGCPSLCNYHLDGVTEAFKKIPWSVGKEFEFVALSMDDKEDSDAAKEKKDSLVQVYGRVESAKGWHFLTGTKENIATLARQVGFSFRWDEETQQFAHASAAIVLAPDGQISRYVHGINPDPQNLRLALIEASQGKVGNVIDRLVLKCFKFDPTKSKYTLYAWNIMQMGAGLTVLILLVTLLPVWWRQKRQQSAA